MIEERFSMGRIQRKAKRIKRMIIIGIIILILLIVWGFYMVAQLPYREAKSESFQMAAKYAKVDNIENFYIYNRNSTYYTIEGKNNDNQDVYVVIPKKGNKVNIYEKSKGISQKSAENTIKQNYQPKKIVKTVFGMKNGGTPLWEVAYQNKDGNLCYAQVAFKTGKVLQNITNM